MLHYFHPINKLSRYQQSIETKEDWPIGLKTLIETPIPDLKDAVALSAFIALDIETTGMNAACDKILSIGTVGLQKQIIDIQSSSHIYIDECQTINAESVVINHIVPEMLEEGAPLDVAMDNLFAQLAGKAVVVHGAVMEKSFLDTYVCQRFGLKQLPILWIDTLKIEKEMTFNQHGEAHSFQLNTVRNNYKLPEYPAHNALIDAIACAELFLVQMNSIFGKKKETLTFQALINSKVAS